MSKHEIETFEDIRNKLTRIETRMLRGFDALGVNVKAAPGWLMVNNKEQLITINSPHYTLHAIHEELDRLGIITDGRYRVLFQNKTYCYL